MPFDGFAPVSASVASFAAEHNLTLTPKLARMSLRELRAHYEACAYAPKTNGIVYSTAAETPDMFGFDGEDENLIPRDRVHHDEPIMGHNGSNINLATLRACSGQACLRRIPPGFIRIALIKLSTGCNSWN